MTTRKTQECKMRSCTYPEQRSYYITIMDEGDMEWPRARAHDMDEDQSVEQESRGNKNESIGV